MDRSTLATMCRYIAVIFAVLVMSIGQAWGTSVTYTVGTGSKDISDQTCTINDSPLVLKTCSIGSGRSSRQIWKDGGTNKNENTVQLSKSAGNDPSTKYIEISISEGYKITGVTVRGTSIDGGPQTYNAFCFEGDYSTEAGAVKGVASLAFYQNTCTSDQANVSMTDIADNTRTIRIYKQVKYNSSTHTIGNVTGASATPATVDYNVNIASITVTYEAASSNTYTYTGQDNSWGSTAMTVSDGGLYEYVHSTRQSDHQFKIKEGSTYYNWTYTFPGFCMTNLTTLGNQDGDNCKVWDTPSSYYIIVFKPNTTLNSSSNPRIATSTTLPDDTEEGLAKTKMVYLVPGSGWETSSPKYAVYYEGHSRGWSDYMTACPCIDGAYQVEIPALFSSVQFMRMNPEGGKSWNDGDYWNYTAMVTMPTNKPKFTVNLTNANWNSASTDGSNWSTVTTYTISFNANKGSGSISSITGINCNTSRTLPTNTFTRTGWTFVGWNTDKYGGGTSYADGATISNITSNITLYAQWQRTIYFYASGDGSPWYNDGAVTQLHAWDSEGSHDLYLDMTRANQCSSPVIYEATISGGGYDRLQFKRLVSGTPYNQTVDLSFVDSYNMYNLTHMNGGAGNQAYGEFASNYSIPTYTVSAAASTAGYGTVSAASVTGVACGTSISASSNTLTVGATTVTATQAESDAQYTYAFDGWTWTPAGSTVTSDVTATANFTRTLNSYTVTWKNGATTLETDASVNYGATPTYDGSTPTKDADALYTYAFSAVYRYT